jgi:hypothetical protein
VVQNRLTARKIPYNFPLHVPLPIARGAVVSMGEQSICGSKVQGKKPDLEVETRSVVDIIDFLGRIVRYKTPLKVYTQPEGSDETVIFQGLEQAPPGPSISATVDGNTYYIKVNATSDDMSSNVIQLLSELIALNSSAKDLPAPNVITVISP